MLGNVYMPEVTISHSLEFSEHKQKCWAVFFELGGQLHVSSQLLSESFSVSFVHHFGLRYQGQTIGRRFVVYSIDRAVTFSRFCAREARQILVFNVNYFFRCIHDFANLLVLGPVNVRHAKVGDGNMKGVALLNVNIILTSHSSMILGHVWIGNYLY